MNKVVDANLYNNHKFVVLTFSNGNRLGISIESYNYFYDYLMSNDYDFILSCKCFNVVEMVKN